MLEWVNWMSEVMAEAMRVMKPGAIGLVWSIPRTSHWTGMALELAGFRIIDVVHHCQGSGFPKSQDIGKIIDKMAGRKGRSWETLLGWEIKKAMEKDGDNLEISAIASIPVSSYPT